MAMRNGFGVATLFALTLGALCGCLDRSDEYDSINEARSERVFEKGWLPGFLPETTRDLKVVTTVDVSAGRGRFIFDPEEYPSFSARLSDYDGSMPKIDGDAKAARRLLYEGYEARVYSSGGTYWLFLCESGEGVCEFFVWQ